MNLLAIIKPTYWQFLCSNTLTVKKSSSSQCVQRCVQRFEDVYIQLHEYSSEISLPWATHTYTCSRTIWMIKHTAECAPVLCILLWLLFPTWINFDLHLTTFISGTLKIDLMVMVKLFGFYENVVSILSIIKWSDLLSFTFLVQFFSV